MLLFVIFIALLLVLMLTIYYGMTIYKYFHELDNLLLDCEYTKDKK